ncbi:MAG: porin [Mesorhizobium amorphae]|nr:MAG: porin [Mesorhizobium amorphae]
MNIKSLLLGSAAALVAVSGAQAADAVVMAEPEPMEYVRVCDVYGTGFFYIPGTETCLRVGGYVRFDINGGDLLSGERDTYNTLGRFSLQVSTASETELGTLRTYAETRFNYANGGNDVSTDFNAADPNDPINDTGVSLNFAWIQLGGFRVGKDESLFTTWTGYAGNVIKDDQVVGYGPFDTNLISYTFDFGQGFSAAVSVEEGADTDEIDSYVPHVAAGLKYTAGFGALSAVGGYDANNEEFAGKVRADITINDAFALFVMGGYKTDDGEREDESVFDFNDGTNYFGNWRGGDADTAGGGDGYAIWAGASYVVTPQATINGQVSYDEGEAFQANLNVQYEVVPGFRITPEVVYANYGDTFDPRRPSDGDSDEWGGVLRFQRSF